MKMTKTEEKILSHVASVNSWNALAGLGHFPKKF